MSKPRKVSKRPDSSRRGARDPRWEPARWERALSALAQRVGCPEVTDHLREAMTHRSFANEQRLPVSDNQRLEFLGDALVGSATTLELWERKRGASEGELSSTRARLINAETLSQCADELHLDEVLRLGQGEPNMGPHARRARLADAFEALVGALYLDLGQAHAQRWVWAQLDGHFHRLQQGGTLLNIKTQLQHKAHELGLDTPRYERLEGLKEGERRVRVWVGEQVLSEVSGAGGRRATEEEAARLALSHLSKQ